MKKIIIFGFPHSGTSILKSIIGHIEDVCEIYDETKIIDDKMINLNKNLKKKYILCKYPYTDPKFFTDIYKNYIKIFIIRNPLWIFSSLNKRFLSKIPKNHNLKEYTQVANYFDYYKNHPIENLHLIRYEDMFEDNFRNLKSMLDNIGFLYDDNIFNNHEYKNIIVSQIKKIPQIKPDNKDHNNYRTWQINQQFENNNDPSKIDLNPIQIQYIQSSLDIKKVYSEDELKI